MLAEAEAIRRTAERCTPPSLDAAISLLSNIRSKAIVSGLGKSGDVARKVASTLTSTGCPAVFIHPVDALHGDLGIVSQTDVAILLSHSGETKEVLELMSQLLARKIQIIAICSRRHSCLAQNANVCLITDVREEACPFNLAPSSSTACAMAFGDAIALASMVSRKNTTETFLSNHPAGRLGKRLSIPVKDVMRSGDRNPTVAPWSPITNVLDTMTKQSVGTTCVVDASGELVGIITDGDVRRWLLNNDSPSLDTVASQLMTERPVTVSPTTSAHDALYLMERRESQISVLPVVDEINACVGLVLLHDILKLGIC